jgi:HSP20 family protein
MRELEAMSSRLNNFFGALDRPGAGEGDGFGDFMPAIDVQETDAEYLVKADLPAIKREEVKVALENGTLVIEGERKQEKEEKGKKFHRVERSYGRFVRRMLVPSGIDQQKVEAEFKDGVLSVHLPKAAEAKPRTVDIKVA